MITKITLYFDAPCFVPKEGADLNPAVEAIRKKVQEGIWPNIAGKTLPDDVSVELYDQSDIDDAQAEILMQVANEVGHWTAMREGTGEMIDHDLIRDRLARGFGGTADSRRHLVSAAALSIAAIVDFDQRSKVIDRPKQLRCPACRGVEIPYSPCGACGGSGYIEEGGP